MVQKTFYTALISNSFNLQHQGREEKGRKIRSYVLYAQFFSYLTACCHYFFSSEELLTNCLFFLLLKKKKQRQNDSSTSNLNQKIITLYPNFSYGTHKYFGWSNQKDRMCVRTRDSFHHSLPAIKLDWECSIEILLLKEMKQSTYSTETGQYAGLGSKQTNKQKHSEGMEYTGF